MRKPRTIAGSRLQRPLAAGDASPVSAASLNSIIDLSHHNGTVDLGQAASDGILAVIHKATQGAKYTDPMYAVNLAKARAAGLLWGAYHFGTGSDGTGQADYFLQTVQPDGSTLLVLDLEANPQGPSMSLEEARAFVTHVFQVTRRWPGLYAGHYLKELLGSQQDTTLANCWFWLSQFGPTAVVPPNWSDWTMWQYTDGGLGPEPHQVAGIGRCDRDRFNGDKVALDLLWRPGGPATAASTDQ